MQAANGVPPHNKDLYELFQEVFDALPLAAIIETKEMGRLFCCHGGLSPSFKTIEDINNIDRFQEQPHDGSYSIVESPFSKEYIVIFEPNRWPLRHPLVRSS